MAGKTLCLYWISMSTLHIGSAEAMNQKRYCLRSRVMGRLKNRLFLKMWSNIGRYILGGEENILCFTNGQDRYPNQDIFLHEFVHGLHNLGAYFSIPDFDDRLRKRYNSVKTSGKLWQKTYAMSTHWEYLAEGAQSFFDCNAQSDPPNGIYNHVNTRTELKSYDPVLYEFLKEIFPCQNRLLQRCDAKAGTYAFFLAFQKVSNCYQFALNL